MATPYIGEIRMFAGNFAPENWAFCNGSVLSIAEYDVLFNLLGTTYGGDGVNTFALPDMRGRVPVHVGLGFVLGQKAGAETVTLGIPLIPSHSHSCDVSTDLAGGSSPTNNVPGQVGAIQIYREATPTVAMSPNSLASIGGNQPHGNMQPYLCVSFIISLFGVFPSQT